VTGGEPDDFWRRVCPESEVREKRGRCYVVGFRSVAIFRDAGRLHAVSARCPHNGQSLHDGNVEAGVVTCRWHGWQFDLASGRPPGAAPGASGPSIRVYALRVREGWVEVNVPEA
jgi:nitrite reductase/ring-hydroxylating ferredoxin subunit